MQEHEQFGRPPNLRPRSTGAARASPRSVPVEQLAREANSLHADAAATLSERLHIPRPGSASSRVHVSPRLAMAAPVPVTGASGRHPVMEKELKPTVLLSKPPMRPRSALMGSRGIVSQHRKELLQHQIASGTTASTSNNQATNEAAVATVSIPVSPALSMTPQLQRVIQKTTEKDEGVASRSSSASVRAAAPTRPTSTDATTTRLPLKRPFSAAPSIKSAELVSVVPGINKQTLSSFQSTARSATAAAAPRAERPFSAAAAIHGGSLRTNGLQLKTDAVGSHGIMELSEKTPPSRAQPIGLTANAMAIMSSYHRDTFAYAVPRHCFERGRQYNPYDIVTVSHDTLFGTDLSARTKREARFDYYTVSSSGMTFYCKEDDFMPSFDSPTEWERQKTKFDKICKFPTFQLFRYRKAFLGWKRWIRSTKFDHARTVLLSSLYFSQPVLSAGMKEIQRELRKLQNINLTVDFEGSIHHLSVFSAKSSDHVQHQGFEILKITGQIQQILVHVCHECLNSTESAYGGFPGHEFALSTRKSSNFHIFEAFVERERALATANHQLVQHQHFQTGNSDTQPSKVSLSMAAQFRTTHRKYIERVLRAQQQRPQDALDEIRWTMAAIQRRRCVLLTKFVALIDFMALDALHSLLTRSFQLLRDNLWVGANAGSISRLLDRQDYVLAFHQTLEARQSGSSRPPTDARFKAQRKIELNKQQTKRFLRAAWEPKLATLVRSATSGLNTGGPQIDDDADSSQHSRSSAAVWLESRLESFFMQALTQLGGSSTELFGIAELMHVVENSIAQALVLPDFNAQQCSIQDLRTSTVVDNQEGFGSGSTTDLQVIEALAPVALFHINMVLEVDETSKKCSIVFKPTLDRVFLLIKEAISSFVELFQGIPSIVLHQELRAILEFAEDFRAASITRGDDNGGNQDSEGPVNNGVDGEDEQEESRWNKSNYDRLFFRVGTDQSCSMLHLNVDDLAKSAINGAVTFAGRYDELLATYTRNENVNFDEFRVRFRKGQYSLKEMESDVLGFAAQIEELRLLKEAQTIEFLQFDMSKLKEALLPSPERCLRELHGLFPLLALEKCEAFLVFVRNSCKKIEKPMVGAEVEKFARYLLNLRDVQDAAEEKEYDLTFIHDLFRMLGRLEIEISAEISESFDLCDPEFEALKSQLNEALAKREADIHERSPLLTADVKKLSNGIETLKTNSTNQTMNSGDSVSHDARDLANALEKEAEVLSERSTQLLWVQRVFCEFSQSSRPPPEEFTDLAVVSTELKLKNELWEAVADAEEYLTTKQDETLRDIDLGHLRDVLTKVDAVIKRLQQKAVQTGAVKRLENCKSVLEGLTPVIRDLRNENVEERHWTKLEHKMKCSFVRQVEVAATTSDEDEGSDEAASEPEVSMKAVKYLDLPLRHLLEIEAVNHAAVIHQVSEEAAAEAAITKSFVSVAKTWETREIPSHAKKDREGRDAIYLGDCAELMTLIEESEVLLRVMESSTFARVIHTRLSKLLQDLAYAKETMELLVVCHQKWQYLQRLVSADFVRLFPEQGKALQVHDANWKGIMETVLKRPLCLPFGINAEYRQTLQATLQGFEYAAKHLEQHLELKRQAFPALFKLSNTELATLLSKVRDINNIQQFLYQCFDNVARINFGTREACQDVLSVTSRAFPQAETISMGKNLKARGPPEQWLVSVEKRLVEMLRKGTKEAVVMLSQGPVTTANALDGAALQALPLQCILLADRILRSELIDSLLGEALDEAFFTPSSLDRIYSKLHQFHANVIDQVIGASESDWTVARSPREIVLQSCLRLHAIEFRDAIAEHILSVRAGDSTEGSSGGLGIQWQLQLKHRFDDSTTVGYDCHVEMDGARVPYGFNYVNPNAELIFMPRSLRFVFSVFAATRHAQTALLTGPTGSGKQSLAVQISRLFGRRFFGTSVSQPTAGSSMFFQVGHCLRLVRGALQVGGIMCIAVQQCLESVDLLRVLSATVSRIEYSVLCKLPITGLQKDPISWVPGTTLLVTCRLLPSASPLWESVQYKFDVAAAGFSRISVMPDHDLSVVLEALAYSKCLEAPRRTAQRLVVLWRHLNALDWLDEVSEIFSLGGAKHVIAMVAQDAWKNAESFERENLQRFLICEAVLRLIRPWILKIGTEQAEVLTSRVTEALDEVFQYQQHQQEWYTRQWRRQQRSKDDPEFKKCAGFVEEVAQDLHFVPRRQLAIKSVELARGLAANLGVIMAGPSGVGKTTTYSVLASALDQWKRDLLAESHALKSSTEAADAKSSASHHIGSDASSTAAAQVSKAESAAGPFVSVHVVLPMALTLDQLFGSTSNDPKGQIKSVFGRLIRAAQESFALSTEHEIQHTIESRTSVPGLAPILAMQKLTWVVIDGGAVCGGVWLDILLSILTRKYVFGLLDCCESPNRQLLPFLDGEFMTIPPNLRFIFESWNLNNATPAMLQQCALVVFPAESEAIQINKDEDVDALPIHFACIQRFLEQQRLAATAPPANDLSAKLSTIVYDTVTNRLLGTEILAKISGVMKDYGVTVRLTLLQRVEYMLSLLQALLHTVAVTCSSSRKPQDTAAANNSAAIPEEDVQHRVDMAIVYSLLWGFSACCASGYDDTRYRALQLLISGIIKTHFEEIAHSWEDCGRDANFFELLLDINGLRFVSLESGDTVTLRDKIWRHTLSTWSGPSPSGDQLLHSLFIPTQSSLIVHAAMKEAIRSARGVLLVGSETSRKTTLLQNFLKQLEALRILTTSSYASIPPPVAANASDLSDSKTRRKRAVPLLKGLVFPNTDNAFASLDRIRLHQVGLVKRLAKRFRKVNKAAAAAAALAVAQRYGSSRNKSGDGSGQAEGQEGDKKSKLTKKDQEWLLHPHLSEAKSTMISKFDLGDVIPFYFAMNQHDRGVQELAKCLERMLQRERSGIYEPPPGKAAVLIIDDLHLPVVTHDEEHPSCHEYLRSAYEHATVLSTDVDTAGATPIKIENLMMVASIETRALLAESANTSALNGGASIPTRHYALDKLTKQFLPVYAPPCSPLELHTIFNTLMIAQWESVSTSPLDKLSSTVRQIVPVIVAATTVLWEKLRRRWRASVASRSRTAAKFDLHVLKRVYAGLCAVEPSYILDIETMTRLWAHESSRSFGDLPASTSHWREYLKTDVFRVRILLDGLDPQHLQRGTTSSVTTTIASPAAATKTTNTIGSTALTGGGGESSRVTNLSSGMNATGYLGFFTTELLTPDTTRKPGDLGVSAQQRAGYERKKLHVIAVWAFVPSSLYYQSGASESTGTPQAAGGSAALASPLQRRNSIRFIRRKSMENLVDDAMAGSKNALQNSSKAASLGIARWIYAELPALESSGNAKTDELTSVKGIQSVFSGIRIFGETAADSMSLKPVTDLLLQMQVAQLPRAAPVVTPLMARNIAQLERVVTPQGSRVVLVAPAGSGREVLLRYACAVRQTSQPQSVWTVEGVRDTTSADMMAKKWKHVVHQLFLRVGVEFESVTLVVKRLTLWPEALINQLIALIVSGEIPGAFSLDEQIQLATRVRDERLIELEQRYQSQVLRIRQEIELQKDEEILARKDGEEASALTGQRKAVYYQEMERKYQHLLLLRLSQVQVRHQQELDDFLRKCEVENESVTATIMSLMRPLGMTSGKWQQIVQRVRKRLKIVVLVDTDEYPANIKIAPQLFRVCSVATLSSLDLPSLQTALYGSFRAEVESVFRKERQRGAAGGRSTNGWNSVDEQTDLVRFFDRVEHELPKITEVAAEMHSCAKTLASSENRKPPTELGVVLARFFAKLVRYRYHCERDERAKSEWFSYVHKSMEQALWKLQDRDGELRAQLSGCDQQIEISQELLVEQKEDCDRIRDMMKRYQDAAEEQVQVTNEMEMRAQAELHVPMACLEEANAALLMIDKRHIIEIKSFNSPPLLVHFVLDAICVMFQLEPAWENARKILSDANVVHTLLTFDKDNISGEILTKLETTYICDPRFYREEVEKQSVAASMMVVWVRAIYQYATARRLVMPTLEKLEQAQSRLKLLMQEYQVSKQRVIEAGEALAKTKEALEKAIELRKETVDEMESRKTRLDGGRVVLQFLGDDKSEADKSFQQLEKERGLGLTWWNALLDAGSLTYASYFDASDRVSLFKEWTKVVRRAVSATITEGSEDVIEEFLPSVSLVVKQDQNDSNANITETTVAEETDLSASVPEANPRDPIALFSNSHKYWEFASACGHLFSERNIQDAFLLTQTALAGFSVILVTEYSSEMEVLLVNCARYVWKWSQFFMVSAKASDLETTVITAIQEGHQLLILDVDPLDIEFKLGNLWWLYHWNQSSSPPTLDTDTSNESTEYLSIPPSAFAETPIEDPATSRRVAVHTSFRAIFTTQKDGAAFGDTLLTRVPVISAQLHTSDLPDIILDKLWHPGLFEGGQHGFGLKQSVREFERLCRQSDDAQKNLTKLIQGAAVRGQFQREETDLIRVACTKTKEIRNMLAQKRKEIHERMKAVQNVQTLSRLGAALFSSINNGPESRVSLQLFLPMFMAVLKKPTPALNSSPTSLMRQPSSSTSPLRSLGRSTNFGSQQQGSMRTLLAAPAKGNGFDSISEIMKKMLEQLMPLVRDVSEWYEFLVHMLWLQERQYSPERSPPNAAAQEAAIKAINSASSERRVRRFLSTMKIGHWKSQAVSEDYLALTPHADSVLELLVPLVVNGHNNAMGTAVATDPKTVDVDGINNALAAVFAASRCRAERVKTAMSMYPFLVRPLCDRILQAYGVQVRFASSDVNDVAAALPSSASPSRNSSIQQFSTVSQGLIEESTYSSAFDENPVKVGWLRILEGLPRTAVVLLRSDSGFGSFSFLSRVFQATTASDATRLQILKLVTSRTLKTSLEAEELFLLPHQRLQPGGNADRSSGRGLSSSLSDVTENALMILDSKTLLQMNRDKLESFLDDVPLTIVNLQERQCDPAKTATLWEDLYHMIQHTPERTTSTELRRYESNSAQSNSGVRVKGDKPASDTPDAGNTSAGGAVSLISQGRGPTARRFSTQNVQHRRSDAGTTLHSAMNTLPPFLTVVDDTRTIPDHLRGSMVAFASEATELGSDCMPSLKQSLQETLARVAYHPCSELIRQCMPSSDSESASKTQTASTGSGSAVEANQDADSMARLLWHYLTALAVFHAILRYRWKVSIRQYASSSSLGSPIEGYSWDVLTTALDQLFQALVQLRTSSKSSSLQLTNTQMEALLIRVKQQVVLSSYTRQTTTPREFVVLRTLCRECLCLVQDSTTSVVDMTALLAPGISNSRSMRSHRTLQVGSSSRMMQAPGITPSAPSGYNNASSRKIFARRSSLGDAIGSLVSGLNLPLEVLRTSVKDTTSWLETMWSYTTQIDGAVENLVRDLFGLLPPCDLPLVPHPAASVATEHWSELFGWIKQPTRYGSLASQFSLDDALQCLELMHEKIIPAMIEDNERGLQTGGEAPLTAATESVSKEVADVDAGRDDFTMDDVDTPSASRSSLGSVAESESDRGSMIMREDVDNKAVAAFVPNARRLLEQCITSFIASYNRHIRGLRSTLEETVEELKLWRDHTQDQNSVHRQTLESVGDPDTQATVLAILCNRVPIKLRQRASASPTYLMSSGELTLDALITHYQRWYENLHAQHQSLRGEASATACQWWLPGVPAKTSINHLIHVVRLPLAHKWGISAELLHQQYELSFTLHVDAVDSSTKNPGSGDDPVGKQSPESVVVVFSGLELRLATWDGERGYLQSLDRLSSRIPQTVSIVCRLEKRAAFTTQDTLASGSSFQPPQAKKHGVNTRSCPLVTRDGVAYEFHLPIGPAFGSIVQPYLTLAVP